MRRILEPWTPKDDERLKALAAHRCSASPPHYDAGKELPALTPGNSAAPFRPCALLGKSGPTRRTINDEIKRPRLHIRVRVKWPRALRFLIFTRVSCVESATPLRLLFWLAPWSPSGVQLGWSSSRPYSANRRFERTGPCRRAVAAPALFWGAFRARPPRTRIVMAIASCESVCPAGREQRQRGSICSPCKDNGYF
jgi:hypothetical protein